MNELNWPGIALMLTVPPAVSLLVAVLCWRRSEMILGNITGTTAIFGAAAALIFREHIELEGMARTCLESGVVCWPQPSAFIRYAIYAFIGLIEVFALFAVSLKVEEKIRNRRYAPEWR